MRIPAETIYPRTGDRQTVYLRAVVHGHNISVGDYTIYNDFVRDPVEFERNNVLYHYPVNGDRLVIGKYCSIACGAKFLLNSANHTLRSLSTYPFPIFYEAWGTPVSEVSCAARPHAKQSRAVGIDASAAAAATASPTHHSKESARQAAKLRAKQSATAVSTLDAMICQGRTP